MTKAGGIGAGDVIRAAGGVVWRTDGVAVEIVIVHRPRYDDWSLPKGKLDPGEAWEDAAVREVLEETGLRVELGHFLHEVEYVDGRSEATGRPKVVRYWAMRALGGTFTPHREVDMVRWQQPDDAIALLTYAIDHDTVRRFLALNG